LAGLSPGRDEIIYSNSLGEIVGFYQMPDILRCKNHAKTARWNKILIYNNKFSRLASAMLDTASQIVKRTI
jgi:hypothetical protein